MFPSSTSSSNRAQAFRFALRAALFGAPLLLAALLFEIAMYRTGESWPITKVIAAQEKLNAESLLGRANFSQQYNLSKSEMIRRRHPRILALGSSRVMEFRSFMFHPYEDAFYNAGGLIQNVNDLAAYARQVKDGTLPAPQVVIVGIDPWWVSEAADPLEKRSWLDEEEDAVYSFASHVEAARSLLRTGKSNFPWAVALGGKPAVTPFYNYPAFGVTAVAAGLGERYSDGSYLYTAHLVDSIKHPGYRDRANVPIVDQVKRTFLLFKPSSKVESGRAALLIKSLASLKALGIEVYVFEPPFSTEVVKALDESQPLARFWLEYKNDLRDRIKEAGIECLPLSTAKSYGLDDSYLFDGIHPGEVFDSYIVEDLIRHAPSGSLLSSVDLHYLAELRANASSVPLSFYPPPHVFGASENRRSRGESKDNGATSGAN